MHTDASNRAIGGVLVQDGRLIAYECRKLKEKFLLEKEAKKEEGPDVKTPEELTQKTEEVLVHPAYP